MKTVFSPGRSRISTLMYIRTFFILSILTVILIILRYYANPNFPRLPLSVFYFSQLNNATRAPLAIRNPFIAHYFLLQKSLNPTPDDGITWLDCVSVFSVLKFLEPDYIYLHTNVPEFWPFAACEKLITNWSTVELIYSPRKFTVGSQKLARIEHEADIKKLEAVLQYAGVVLDFDVLMINGTKLREALRKYPCVGCREVPEKLNAGFLACGEPNAQFPQLVMEQSYVQDYWPEAWTYNSGDLPFIIYSNHTDLLNVDNGVCDRPDWEDRFDFWNHTGIVEWQDKIAHHTFCHDRNYTEEDVKMGNSTMAEMLSWILYS